MVGTGDTQVPKKYQETEKPRDTGHDTQQPKDTHKINQQSTYTLSTYYYFLAGCGGITRASAEAPHEHPVDLLGGIPRVGGVVGMAENPGGAARRVRRPRFPLLNSV